MFRFLILAAGLLLLGRLAAGLLPHAFGAAAAAARLVRRTVTALLIASLGTLAWSLADGAVWGEHPGLAWPVFGALFAGGWLWRQARDRRRRSERATLTQLERGEGGGRVAVPRTRPADRPVDAAWGWAADTLDGHGSRIAVARASCDRFLAHAADRPLDVDAIEWASFIRSHVPSFLDRARTRRRALSGEDRRRLDEQTVATLERIGAEADRRAAALSTGADEFDIQRAHIERRTASD